MSKKNTLPVEPAQTNARHVRKATARFGWWFEQLVLIESLFAGRWSYWLAIQMNLTIGDKDKWPIPQIEFSTQPSKSPWFAKYAKRPELLREIQSGPFVASEATKLLDSLTRDGTPISSILDWWLWACGDLSVKERPSLSDQAEVELYRGMGVLCRMIANPMDWGVYLASYLRGGSGKANTGWFPTPASIAELTTRMTIGSEDDTRDKRLLTVCDPCVGTGIFLLLASNYSLRLYGQDIDSEMVRWSRLQAWLYVPWLAQPCPWLFPKPKRKKRTRDERIRDSKRKARSGARKPPKKRVAG